MTAPTPVRADHMSCWYAEGATRPRFSRCPTACHGATTHAELQADGGQRFYCENHAFWRSSEVGRDRLRALRPGELC